MKVLQLEMEGFGPYLARQTIDFTAFDDDIFVITGKTGAGKSTILDAIVFALYDAVPRYDGAESQVRSHFCGDDDPTLVTLEFESGGQRYKVSRSPEYRRPKKRGDGLTTQKAQATLWVDRDGQWEALEVQLRDVNRRIGDIMQLTAEQFLQVILLAQGRFQEFLDANTHDRLKVLRSLFGTVRFEQLERHVREVAKERSRAVEAADAGLSDLVTQAVAESRMAQAGAVGGTAQSEDTVQFEYTAQAGEVGLAGTDGAAGASGATGADGATGEPTLDSAVHAGEPHVVAPGLADRDAWFIDTAALLRGLAQDALAMQDSARTKAESAAQALTETKALADKHAQLATARETVATLEGQADEHALDAARLAAARRAKPVAAPMRAVELRQAELDTASQAREQAVADALAAAVTSLAWPQSFGELSEATEEDLTARVIELQGDISGLSDAVAQELKLPGLHEDSAAAATALEAALEVRDAVTEQLEALPGREQALRGQRDQVGALAARVTDLEAALERALATAQAHARIAQLQQQLQAAQVGEAESSQGHADAVAEHNALVQQRLRSQAAHLAVELVDGEPCTVCGALAHPSPAQPTDAHVTDEQVDQAGAIVTQARKALDAATETVRGLDKQLAGARELAGTGDEQAAQAARDQAEEALRVAQDAATEHARLDQELAKVAGQAAALKESLSQKAKAVEAAQAAHTAAVTAATQAESIVATARADYESVGSRARDLERAQTLVRSIALTTGDLARAQSALTQAQESLADALAEADFEDVAGASAAVLPDSELAALETAVREYERDLAGARAVVKNLDVAGLAPAPTNVAELAEAAQASTAARDAAVAAATASAQRSERFSRLAADYATRASASESARRERDQALTLADSFEGNPPNDRKMRLESFVLASKLERIVAAANARLEVMSAGQYRLEHDDERQYRNAQTGLGLRIADAHTGQSRSTRSLSGGEKFLASLALALGLAETVTAEAGGIRLSTLFIDEGFGSLDDATRELAMSTLDELRAGGRTIGLISHVNEMKEQIPLKLNVEKAADGSSRVVSHTPQAR